MRAANWPRDRPAENRLLVIDVGTKSYIDCHLADLPRMLKSSDLVVVNDAATLPAALRGYLERGQQPVELRLLKPDATEQWQGVLLGAGDWRTRTESRGPPPLVHAGDTLVFDRQLTASVVSVTKESARWITVRFNSSGAALWTALYRVGTPVQYSHVRDGLRLWHIQTAFSARPWAVEAPSAGLPLTWSLLTELLQRGVEIRTLTHAAGLSATGDKVVDSALPLAERYEIPEATARAVQEAHARGGRIIAMGTTVTRALEGCAAQNGRIVAGQAETGLRLGPGFIRRVVDGLLTGLHDPGSSHFQLLQAFAPESLLGDAYTHMESLGYLSHEFGDGSLILGAPSGARAA